MDVHTTTQDWYDDQGQIQLPTNRPTCTSWSRIAETTYDENGRGFRFPIVFALG